jgi:WD40 repeat protein
MSVKLLREKRLPSPVVRISLAPGGESVACAAQNGKIYVLRVADLAIQWAGRHGGAPWRKAAASAVSYACDGMALASGSFEGSTVIWTAQSGKPFLRIPHESQSWVLALGFEPGGDALAIAHQDGVVAIWDVANNIERARLVHNGYATAVDYAATGKRIVSAGFDKRIRLWDTSEYEELWQAEALSLPSSVSFSPDGGRILANGFEEMARIVSVEDYSVIENVVHEDEVISASFSPGGQWIVTYCRDRTVGLWDAESYERLETLPMRDSVSDIAPLPDEEALILATGPTIRVLGR